MIEHLYILDLLGTMAFAMYGTYFAIQKDFDLFGIFVSAFLSALGGGTIREMILNELPPYFHNIHYLYVVLFAILITILIEKNFNRIQFFLLSLDSLGLVTFAYIGASRASHIETGTFGIIFLATITAVGGGILRDILLNEIPKIMQYDIYASIAILLGLIYSIFEFHMKEMLWANLLIFGCFALRLMALYYRKNLWKPTKNVSEQLSMFQS